MYPSNDPHGFMGFSAELSSEVAESIITQNFATCRLESVAKHRHFTWHNFTDEQKAALQAGTKAFTINSALLIWAQEVLIELKASYKLRQSRYTPKLYSGALQFRQADAGDSAVFIFQDFVSKPYTGIFVDSVDFNATVTDFTALVAWLKTLKPDRLNIISYRNHFARFEYGTRDSGKPIATAAFAPLSLLWE